jgi:hypothetical protein
MPQLQQQILMKTQTLASIMILTISQPCLLQQIFFFHRVFSSDEWETIQKEKFYIMCCFQVPESLGQHVASSRKAQVKW